MSEARKQILISLYKQRIFRCQRGIETFEDNITFFRTQIEELKNE